MAVNVPEIDGPPLSGLSCFAAVVGNAAVFAGVSGDLVVVGHGPCVLVIIASCCLTQNVGSDFTMVHLKQNYLQN